jgi:hypothetical protein
MRWLILAKFHSAKSNLNSLLKYIEFEKNFSIKSTLKAKGLLVMVTIKKTHEKNHPRKNYPR